LSGEEPFSYRKTYSSQYMLRRTKHTMGQKCFRVIFTRTYYKIEGVEFVQQPVGQLGNSLFHK
ncbi:hypothetical protein, partial [Vibrio anguillarum]|uniref:hypothetical protein n=2 Tax=Vibrio anguillarum TaxID=55601 RepID=UPI001BE48CEF